MVFRKKIAMKKLAFREYLENYLIFFPGCFWSPKKIYQDILWNTKKKYIGNFSNTKFRFFFFLRKNIGRKKPLKPSKTMLLFKKTQKCAFAMTSRFFEILINLFYFRAFLAFVHPHNKTSR